MRAFLQKNPTKIFFTLMLAVEIFALSNRGGGPLLSYLFLTGIVFIVTTLSLIFSKKLPQSPSGGWSFWAPYFAYLFFFFAFVASLFTSLTSGFGLAELLLFANAGILLFLMRRFSLSRSDLQFFAIVLITIAVIDTLIGYFIYTHHGFPRFAGTFLSLNEAYTSFGNDYANFLLLCIPVATWLFLQKHIRRTTTILAGSALAILISGFVLSFSRGAWLSLFVIFIITIIWSLLFRKKINESVNTTHIQPKGLLIRTFSVILFSVILINGLQATRALRYETTSIFKKAAFQADEGSASATERLDFWKGALKIIRDRPWLGSGVLSFKFLYPKYQTNFGANWDHPHNIFLKIGVENGIFAAAFFAIFLISAAVVILKFLVKNPRHPILPFGLGALGSLGHNMVDFNYIAGNFVLFMIFIACAFSFAQAGRGLAPEEEQAQADMGHLPFGLSQYTAMFVISFILLGLGAHEGYYNIYFKRGRSELSAGQLDQAVSDFARAEKLFFKRDLVHYMAAAYEKEFQSTKSESWSAKEEELILSEMPKSTIDAKLRARHGEISMRNKAYNRAKLDFSQALKLDPINKFHYYYGFFQAQKMLRKPFDAALREKVLVLLGQYGTTLRNNRHMTVITDNPSYAIALYEMFGMKEEKEELQKIWFEEYIKFSVRYGSSPKVLL